MKTEERSNLENDKDKLVNLLLISLESSLPENHVVKNNSVYRALKRLYFTKV